MLYQKASFTCPAANPKTTQKRWDLAVLSKREFVEKYRITEAEYERLREKA